MKNLLYTLLFSVFFTNLVCSQASNQDFNFVNIKEGIPKTAVSSIIQDHNGFIWIGTNSTGLYKFDGIDYTVYKHKLLDSTSLSSSKITATYIDYKNRLWVGTEKGINIYNQDLDQFTTVVLTEENNEYIISLAEDSSNNLLIGTYHSGLFKLNLESFEVQKVENSTYTSTGEEIQILSIKNSKQGKTFVGTNRGLMEVDPVNNKLIKTRIFLKDKKSFDIGVETIFVDKKDNLWLGTQLNEGLFKCTLSDDINSTILEVKQLKFTAKKIMSIVELLDDTLIFATENDGLFHLKNDGTLIKNYRSNNNNENNILHNSIWSLYVDNNHRIWIGYFNSGVAVSDSLYDKFYNIESVFNNKNSLKASSVTAIIKPEKDQLWIATDGGGVDIFNQKNHKITHITDNQTSKYKGLNSEYIKDLLINKDKSILAGSWDSGLFVLENNTNRFQNYTVKNTNGKLQSNKVISLTEDLEGIIWIGTYDKGVHSFNPKTKEFKKYASEEFKKNNLVNADIRAILVDVKGIIWIGAKTGLYQIRKNTEGGFKVTNLESELVKGYNSPSNTNSIYSLYESSDKNIWIGTQGAGLCKYDRTNNTFEWFNEIKGLPEENIAAIVEDNDNNIWVSGNSGLTKINPKTTNFINYTANDGLLSNDFNFGAAYKDSKGFLYFGNIKGVDYFNPKNIKINTSKPILYLTGFKIFNEDVTPNVEDSPLQKVISETDSIVLSPKQSVFAIEYSGINYTRPEKNNYAYYLKGYENDWNYVGHKRSATYTNLDSGSYTFMLKASNNDGVWNTTPLTLNIYVQTPWWRQTWAISLYLLFFLVGVILLKQLIKSRLKEKEFLKNERYQQLQNEELNKRKLQFFTNISHEFRTPLTLILNPLKDIINDTSLKLPQVVKNRHAIMYKNTDRLYRLINELMDLRKLELNKMNVRAEKINIIEFINTITNYFEEETSRKNILLNLDFDIPEETIWADVKMLEKIVFNLLSNAVKVTPDGGAITIEILATDTPYVLPLIHKKNPVEVVEIKISDTGSGLEQDQLEKIFDRFYQVEGLNKTYIGGTGIGLEVVQNFVKLHKGEIKAESKIGFGTVFKLFFAKGNDHFRKDEIILSKSQRYANKEDFLSIPNVEYNVKTEENIQHQKQHTILVVEDNAELRDYLKSELENEYKIILASNGKQGLNLSKEFYPDVIISDIIMPEMDGFEFCKLIKTDPSTSHIPLLMLTAKASIENRIEGLENGADAYMVKPFDLKLLKLRLSQLIKSRQVIFEKYFRGVSGANEELNISTYDKDFIQKMLNYINDNLNNSDLAVEQLAKYLNLSRSQLYRKVKALTGKTVSEFIRKIRLERAKDLLENNSLNINEVCYNVGFASPSYFSKCFKAHFGISPTEIQKK